MKYSPSTAEELKANSIYYDKFRKILEDKDVAKKIEILKYKHLSTVIPNYKLSKTSSLIGGVENQSS